MPPLDLVALAKQRNSSDGPAMRPEGVTPQPVTFMQLTPPEAEVARQMQICNACRYCEGFCAVFPAMTRRLEFAKADVNYLANLCHQCGACYHACQYAPPHEFAVNVPAAMTAVRRETYAEYAWPKAFGGAYRANGVVLSCALAAGLAIFLALGVARNIGSADITGANFYAVFPHNLMAVMFGVVFLFAVLALGIGATRFWRAVDPGQPTLGTKGAAAAEAAGNALALKYLDGGHGDGCNEESDRFTLARKHFHHATFYGFMLCFAATSVATLYHYLLNLEAPYPWLSLPVILGSLGGLGLLVGPAGLLYLNLSRDPVKSDAPQRVMDRGFIALLLLTAASGFALLFGRESGSMPWLLCVHLGIVMALFATLPYGKFAHAVYRCAALLKFAVEKRQPNPVQAGAE